MRHHIAWAILAIVTFAGHMVAGLYTEIIYFLPEYLWFVAIAFATLAIYNGIMSAARTESDKKGMAIASAIIGGIVLLGLLISATSWLFMPEYLSESLAAFTLCIHFHRQ